MTDTTLHRPNAQQFRTGDLVWVKRDNQIILLRDPDGQAHPAPDRYAQEHAPDKVEASKRQVLQQSDWTDAQRQQIAQWQPAPWPTLYWVGHIGIIHMHMGQPWVVDATPSRHPPGVTDHPAVSPPKGVAAQTYAAWLSDSDHTASHVWHGRVKGLSQVQAQATADYAHSQADKHYRFVPWGFASGELFYCSELVWCAVREASGIILDDDASTSRAFWYTPWMLMKSPHVQMLYEPPNRSYGKALTEIF